MRKIMVPGVALAMAAGLFALAMPERASAQEQRFITIGTGGITGVYYPTALW